MGEKYNLYINQSADSDNEKKLEELISMDEIIEWYRDRLSEYIGDVKANDGFRVTMTCVTKKFGQLVRTLIIMSVRTNLTSSAEQFGLQGFQNPCLWICN